jgi:hypothetical protein
MCYTPVMELPRVKKLKIVGFMLCLYFIPLKYVSYLKVLEIDVSDVN